MFEREGDEDSVDRLLAEYLAARDAGVAPPAERWLEGHPAQAAQLREYLIDAQLLEAGLGRIADTEVLGVIRPGLRIGRYVLVRRLGVGGMSVVWEAEQEGLRRHVALKILVGEHTRERIERFRREAEVAAALEHTYIVPIHEVGEQNGLQFFAMKLADADLRSRLDRYAADPKGIADLLGRVARAVHHAHLHGVLHRDLKPANILLEDPAGGGPGTPLVADFGLAKHSIGCDPTEPTRTGTLIGTPGYMSPEQASGRGNKGTVLTDVWGLGAILYALLTGRPPFVGEGELDILRKVLSEDPPRPRAVAVDADPDLETVCLKCLEKDPSRRYPSAEAVAEELERRFRDEPVLARPVGRCERIRRWTRRNPYPTGLIATSGMLVVLVAAAAVGALLLNARLEDRNSDLNRANLELTDALLRMREARAETVDALAKAERAREREAANAALARRAINGYDRIGDSPEARQPGLRDIRKRLYEQALEYYRQYAKQNVDQPGLDLEVAQALRKAAGLCVDLDRLAEARGHADEAIAAFRRLSAARGRDREIEIGLADAWNTRAVVHSRSPGEGARMLMAFRESARAAAACADREDDIEASALLAVVWTNLAVGEASAGRDDDARKAASSARDYAERVIRRTPATTSPAVRAARTIPLLEVELFSAELEWKLGHFTEAQVQFRRVIERMRPLAEASRQGRPAARLAFTLRQYGELLTESGAADPLPVLTEALATARTVSEASPEMPKHRWELAACRGAIGNAHASAGNLAAGLPFLTAALDELTDEASGELRFAQENRQLVTKLLLRRAGTLDRLGRTAEARADFETARRTDDGRERSEWSLLMCESSCRVGDHVSAARRLEAMLREKEPNSDALRSKTALAWARCLTALASDRSMGASERERLAKTYGDNALAALSRLEDRDNERVAKVLADPNLRAIRKDPIGSAVIAKDR